MIEGKSGILNIYPPGDSNKPKYEPTRKRIVWPNGAQAIVGSAENPDQLRGPEFDFFWADELCSWNKLSETWDNLEMASRQKGPLGHPPQGIITTTPRPLKKLKEIMDDPGTVLRTWSTFRNVANLDEKWAQKIIRRYEGTRLGRQELHAEFLSEVAGALWGRENLDETRVSSKDLPEFTKITIGVDPQHREDIKRKKMWEPETGIIVAAKGKDGHAYILNDLSGNYPPDEWGRKIVQAYEDFEANVVVAETNDGGDMVKHTINTINKAVKIKTVRVKKGKVTRAEPISALYEQRRVHHVGVFGQLEDQMCGWSGAESEPSPDRIDALVYALDELRLNDGAIAPTVKANARSTFVPNKWSI